MYDGVVADVVMAVVSHMCDYISLAAREVDNTRGHALIRNLRNGFSRLALSVPVNLRLAVAWPQLAQAI